MGHNLRPICLEDCATLDLDEVASGQTKARCMTLSGGMARMVPTCPASSVYSGYLQRYLQEPHIRHLKDRNKLVRGTKRTPRVPSYRHIPEPARLECITDSSFTAGDTQGLVLSGCCLLLVSGTGAYTPVGARQLVVAAELHAVLNEGETIAVAVQNDPDPSAGEAPADGMGF